MSHIQSCSLPSKLLRLLSLVTVASLASLPMMAAGAVAIGVSSIDLALAGDAPTSNSDLVNTGSPDLMFFSSTAFASPTRINDGNFDASGTGSSIIEEGTGQFPALTTFHLNTVANPLGYQISQLRIFTWNITTGPLSGYEGDSDNHHYIIDYSLVGSADFETLATVDISGTGGDSATWVTLNPVPVLTGVDVIRFTWLDPLLTPDSFSVIAEVDIEGTPVTQIPEPSAIMLGGIVLGAACLRRNRNARA
jgi:hypothetical protein